MSSKKIGEKNEAFFLPLPVPGPFKDIRESLEFENQLRPDLDGRNFPEVSFPLVFVPSILTRNELTNLNGEFVNDLTGLLHDVTTSGKTQTFYDVDAKIATMGLTICKNFKEVPVFWNFFQGSVRQSMIQNLSTNGQDKDVWRKAVDKITNLLHDNTILTLENTSDAVKYAETYLNREITTSDNHAGVLKTDTSDSKEILVLKVDRFNNKRRLDGGARTADKAAVDACKTCGNRHPGLLRVESLQVALEVKLLLKRSRNSRRSRRATRN
jgi:hypothetical protein